ncbi:MAG: DUF692 domain-containing protein [Pseudomonadota bacterium]
MTKRHAIPALAVGVGLKAPHYREALAGEHWLDFFEVHAENFMGAGGPPHRWLSAFAEQFPLSIHGVCLSIGGRDPLDREHLDRLTRLADRYSPALVSEHLAWSGDGGVFLNDLLPPPMTVDTLNRVCSHVDEVQSRLNRRILIENPSRYLNWACNDLPEPEFLNELTRRTGCALLLDINNIFVSASNGGFNAEAYIDAIDASAVGQIHLAGHAIDHFDNIVLRIDNHGARVCDEVTGLYERFIRRAGPRPTLIEWDASVPSFETLNAEARRAKAMMERLEPEERQ